MSAGQAASEASRERLGERLCLAVLILVALVLRTWHSELFFAGPDEGNYLHSAQVERLERGFHPLKFVAEDVAWVQYLSDNYDVDTDTYQHSYLHQLLTRWLYRFGCGAMQAVRMSSALTGTLTVWIAWWAMSWLWPARRRLALLAAAVMAVDPMHVFYSRTGWGQIGFACFFLAYLVVLYRLLVVIPETDRSAMRRAGWSLMALSVLAFGWQEGVAPYIVGCGFVVLAAPWILRSDDADRASDPRSPLARVLRSPRTWTFVWSCIPVGAATLGLALFSAFARKLWFGPGMVEGMGWWEMRKASIGNLLAEQRADLQVGWLVIVLAIVGIAHWHPHDRRVVRFLVASCAAGTLILYFRFPDPHLFRIYMPAWVMAIVFAAVGIAACAEWTAARFGHLAASGLVAAVLVMLFAVAWTSMFGRVESPLFVQHFYKKTSGPDGDYREVDRPILERLRTDVRAGERITVFGDKAAIFRLQDAGFIAREYYFEGPPSEWPDWVVASRTGRTGFEQSPHARKNGGEYEPVVSDTIARWGLYRRVR